jgi:hypothetical protein
MFKLASALALVTIFYNLLEGLVSVFFGLQDGTVTLFGFRLFKDMPVAFCHSSRFERWI